MEQVNIVVAATVWEETVPIGTECFNKITDISPRLKMTDASQLLAREQKGDLSAKAELDALLCDADVLFALRLPQDILRRAPHLKWMQMMSAGVEMSLNKDIIESPVVMTNVSGIHVDTISEYILCMMLMFARQMPLYFKLQQEKKWERNDPMLLRGKTAGIVGLGNIGRKVARIARCFGMDVIATRRSVTEGMRTRYVDKLIPRQKLPELLAESDFVILTLPSTAETTNLIGEKELSLMKSTAFIINIARGNVIDEEALISALEEKSIAGAVLDVFNQEPLPAESKLWSLPNVILTPHVAGSMTDYFSRCTDVFCDNMQRFLAGKRLHHIVNKKRGY